MRLIIAIVLAAATLSAAASANAPASQPAVKRLLFLTHAALYKHTSLRPAEKAVIELGKAGGYEVTAVEG